MAVRSTLASSSREFVSTMAEVGRKDWAMPTLGYSARSSPRRVPIVNDPVRESFLGLMMPNLVCRLSKRVAFSTEFMPCREEITK